MPKLARIETEAGVERGEYEDGVVTVGSGTYDTTTDEATRLAGEARENLPAIDDQTRTVDELIRRQESQEAQVLGLVVDSLSRTGDYGANIAESALQKAAPRP